MQHRAHQGQLATLYWWITERVYLKNAPPLRATLHLSIQWMEYTRVALVRNISAITLTASSW
jgi:hypothetical protein